jgi:hypothetical protein
MQDSPNINILLEAIQDLLIKEILPVIKDNEGLAYKTLVSWNMLGVISREVKMGEGFLNSEIESIAAYLKENVSINSQTYAEKVDLCRNLNQKLNESILKNKSSINNTEVWNLVKKTLKEKLEISNPRYNTSD